MAVCRPTLSLVDTAGVNRFSEELVAFYEATHDQGDIGDESFYLDGAANAAGPVLEGEGNDGTEG